MPARKRPTARGTRTWILRSPNSGLVIGVKSAQTVKRRLAEGWRYANDLPDPPRPTRKEAK